MTNIEKVNKLIKLFTQIIIKVETQIGDLSDKHLIDKWNA